MTRPPAALAVAARANHYDAVGLGERLSDGGGNLRQCLDKLLDDGRLVVLLPSLGFLLHGLCLRKARRLDHFGASQAFGLGDLSLGQAFSGDCRCVTFADGSRSG